MLHVYLAARFSRKQELAGYAAELRRIGIDSTARWLTGVHEWNGVLDTEIPRAVQAGFAQDDLDDIDTADLFVCFGDPPDQRGARGGMCVELGYALGVGMPIVIVGHRQNIFMCLPEIVYCETWDVAKRYVAGLHLDSSGKVRIAA